MHPIGIISGTIPLHKENIFQNLKKTMVKTEFGNAMVFLSETIAFIPRHCIDPKHGIPPHMINHNANLKALESMGVKEVIGINSTGSLKKELEPGTIIIPDDYISTYVTPTIFHDSAVHTIPVLGEGIRKRLIQAAERLGIKPIENGVYWQTAGPRLETRAEIKMMSQFADIIGMTMASEATIAVELGLSYAAICSVDNYAHGIVERPLTPEEISKGARKNARNMLEIVRMYISEFSSGGKNAM
ncbi:MAG: MTAP family purine nucleoside phosphorylase [Thermodesulfobacteriota bacterium]|nr:MTAP family purine nucleoside phosphorylase [Thermodesulfobacteriota bacterium]